MPTAEEYARWRLKHPKPPKKSRLELFEEKWIPEPTSGCWLWTAAYTKDGYGYFGIGDGQVTTSNRAAWILYRGPIPHGAYVLHKCDTPPCVNPDHLYLGTQFENMRDASRSGALSRSSWCGSKTHCPQGHEYTPQNTYMQPRYGMSGKPGRVCRQCRRDYYHRKSA